MKTIAAIGVLGFLLGCATPKVWQKQGASQQDFYTDSGQCRAQAFGAPGMYTMQVALIYNNCMQGKGWYLVDQ